MSWFVVDDSGPGIPEEFQQRVFERFFRPPDASGEGTGLGLAIVNAIVLAHDAEVAVGKSSLGGARLSLQFRFHDY
jgi:signal transduction histidine kinase